MSGWVILSPSHPRLKLATGQQNFHLITHFSLTAVVNDLATRRISDYGIAACQCRQRAVTVKQARLVGKFFGQRLWKIPHQA